MYRPRATRQNRPLRKDFNHPSKEGLEAAVAGDLWKGGVVSWGTGVQGEPVRFADRWDMDKRDNQRSKDESRGFCAFQSWLFACLLTFLECLKRWSYQRKYSEGKTDCATCWCHVILFISKPIKCISVNFTAYVLDVRDGKQKGVPSLPSRESQWEETDT